MPTVVELLRRRASTQPADCAFRFVDDAPGPEAAVSYRELDLAARSTAMALTARGAAGQPVLLLYPPGLDYVAGFLGCLYAGAIAVPAYPPDPGRLDRTLPRLRALVADCGATTALTVSALAELAPGVAAQAPELAALDWLATDLLTGDTEDWRPPRVDGDAPALLQYTSGSTGSPRGVLLSHANLLHNAGLVHAGFGTSTDTAGVSWLPPYHDMGLIGGILQPLYAGFPITLMSPLTFLQRPLSWLEAIQRGGPRTMSGGPNFAFDLCVRKTTPQQRAELDLSGWRLAFCGAEPVRAETLDRFTAAFAPAGFRREAFYPCYGLAEATLIVTGGRWQRRVTCGRPLGDQRLVIADPETGTPRPPGTEGEIWLAGPSVAKGYWRRPAETAHTFDARLAGDSRRYLRTGDLGFLDPAGELVVTGRTKDLIIVRGRNIYPQDLEHAVEQQVAGVRPGSGAAFPVVPEDGAEQVGFACEVADPAADLEATIAAIRQVVAETAEVPVSTVALLRRGRVPKTSSGKIQRYACRRALLAGEWDAGAPDVLTRWDDDSPATVPPSPADSRSPLHLVAHALGLPPDAVPADQPLTRLGLDSLRAVELQGTLESELGFQVTLADLLTGITPAELAERTLSQAGSPAPAIRVSGAPAWGEGVRALWLVQRLAPDSTAYQISRAARIRSALDAEALERAVRALVDRHPALRTRLPARDGEPVRELVDRTGPVLVRHDVAGVGEAELRQRVQADADRPFDLDRGPLFRAALYRRGEADHVLLLSLHHTITDFWSLTVLVDELLAGYAGTDPPPATDPPAGTDRPPDEQALAYWRRVLDGAPPALELPTSRPRPRRQSFRGATEPVRLAAGVLRRLDAFAAAAGVTRFAALSAGFAALLARYTGDEEVVVGAPAAGRGAGQRRALGYFVNPVPLRLPTPAAGTFRELARAAHRTTVDALDHAIPFPRLVEAVRPPRDPSRSPVTQAMVVLLQPPPGAPDLGAFAVGDETAVLRHGGLELQPYRLAERGAAFDLALTMTEVDGELAGFLGYCTDLFDQPAAARLAGQLTALLADALSDPDRPLAALALMGERERAEVLALATGPARRYPDRTTLPELFAERAAAWPAATAVVAGAQRLSYAELAERAGRLAAVLRHRYRVGRGDRVGVYAPRGTDAIVAFWAALTAGGGYLPLPPDLPPRRLALLVEDAGPAVVLTHSSLADRLPAGGPPALCLDQPWPEVPDVSDVADRVRPGTGPDDLAYVIYTSGSTGRPKAVLLGHRGACNHATALGEELAVTPDSRVLQLSSCAYDVHVADILVTHLHGAALHIPPPEATVPGPALVDLLAGQRISHVTVSPSVLAALPYPAELPALRQLLCGGEPLTAELVARWAPGRRFRNAYGPTEATVCVTWGECDPADRRRPSIGRPIPNGRVYVLDSRMEPVPVGVPGEIWIGGVAVAQGYLGRPELTAERFLPDPFEAGGRLYRTGDRARWLPDGSLDFLTRIDDQVKIRGVRVEPGEVAARLRELPEVREAAVVVRPTGPAGADELVAYLVPAGPRRLPVAELRGRLRAELPEPWLPAGFVHLDALPLNRSGKLDRTALPAPTPADRGRAGHLAPRTELERLVAEVWAAVLECATVGVRDHFFDELGGSSLLVGRVSSELGRRLARDVPVTLLFEHPTVEALASRLANTGPLTGDGPDPEEQAARRRRALSQRARR